MVAAQPVTRTELEDVLKHYATKEDVAELRVDIAKLETRLIKWMVGTVILGMGVAAGVASVIQQFIGA